MQPIVRSKDSIALCYENFDKAIHLCMCKPLCYQPKKRDRERESDWLLLKWPPKKRAFQGQDMNICFF